jgi:hypothetical protein
MSYAKEEVVSIGEKRGREEERIKFLKNPYNFNMSIDQIIELTGLIEKEIAKLLQSRDFLDQKIICVLLV